MVQRFFPQLEKLLSQANPDLSLNFEAIETEVWSASMTAAPYSAQICKEGKISGWKMAKSRYEK